MGYFYLLICADGTFYAGSTRDLKRRFWEHSEGLGAAYTRKRLPVTLVYFEQYDRVSEAWGRERRVHGWTRSKKKRLIESGPGVRVTDPSQYA
ncbi:GIY-YIG nuclease family protein [Aeromicrobium stalagmiti]|uniref:GIY-YIG nuclease family protein n=1 Tax=Aeromicrobium stalagmiti TaxID=2738988 RepID=UPI00156927F6|nr:GIY-YIG nuclease family protein [Aeromicrobium stalagmiti]NRQ48680.1 GIY-YIG nuclease family protein [Aeromicrobium stalagmiti]